MGNPELLKESKVEIYLVENLVFLFHAPVYAGLLPAHRLQDYSSQKALSQSGVYLRTVLGEKHLAFNWFNRASRRSGESAGSE